MTKGSIRFSINIFIAAALGLACFLSSQSSATAEQINAKSGQKKIEVLMVDWCPYCRKLISFLKSHNIPFEEHNIEQEELGARMYSQLGGGGIPITLVGNKMIRGYQPEEILEEYER